MGRAEAPVGEPTGASGHGVSDGARTRDTQDHNLVLYQLSYTHRAHSRDPEAPGSTDEDTGAAQPSDAAGGVTPGAGAGGVASAAASTSAKVPVTSPAARWACDVEGPGRSTNSVRR